MKPLLIAAFVSFGCTGNPCEEALEKYIQCKQKLNPDLLLSEFFAWRKEFRLWLRPAGSAGSYHQKEFASTCNDNVKIAGSSQVIALRSWSEKYIDCNIDPSTCECPGLGPWETYKP